MGGTGDCRGLSEGAVEEREPGRLSVRVVTEEEK